MEGVGMKILQNKIKRWSFKQRLCEIKKRVDEVWDDPELSESSTIVLSEAQQIIDYWMTHMKSEVNEENVSSIKIPEKKRNVNLWDDMI
jgi:hypothetical protein